MRRPLFYGQRKCKYEAEEKQGTKSGRDPKAVRAPNPSKIIPERALHLGHLPVFELIHRLKEEHNANFVAFH